MSFDISIERLISELNSEHHIKKIIHIGACLGEEIDFYKRLNPELIYWFEPNPNLLTKLSENIKTNDFISELFPYAVSNKKGEMPFNIIEDGGKTNPGCSSLNSLKEHSRLYPDIKLRDTCLVKTINLDEFLLENNLSTDFDLVSLDTQGHDFEILSSSDVIFNAKVIVIETSSIELYEGQKNQSEIDSFLESKGYYKKHYHAFHPVWGDTLYFKK